MDLNYQVEYEGGWVMGGTSAFIFSKRFTLCSPVRLMCCGVAPVRKHWGQTWKKKKKRGSPLIRARGPHRLFVSISLEAQLPETERQSQYKQDSSVFFGEVGGGFKSDFPKVTLSVDRGLSC